MVPSPTAKAPDRYVYYPGTEELGQDEIRVTACGTGLPAARRGQAATCFLIEAGNGEKFLFDIGTGSMANLASLMIPYEYLDKVFLSHLHTDHMGDILGLWAGGWTSGRPNALRVWGPSGATPEMGTKYAMEHFLKFVNWDKTTREYKITERMAVSTDDAWSVPGTAKQPPPEKGRPNPSTEYIEKGRWIPAFKAQDEMLDRHMEKYDLQEIDWRPAMYKELEGR